MVAFTVDVLLIGLATVLFIGVVKAPIKNFLSKRGLKSNVQMQSTFKAVTMALSFALCFVGALIFFFVFKKINPFTDGIIWGYTVGVLGSSQTIYSIYEVYGRDGLLILIKATLLKGTTSTLTALNADDFGKQVAGLVSQQFEGAPDISDIVATVIKKLQNK